MQNHNKRTPKVLHSLYFIRQLGYVFVHDSGQRHILSFVAVIAASKYLGAHRFHYQLIYSLKSLRVKRTTQAGHVDGTLA